MDEQDTPSELANAVTHVRLARAALLLAVEDVRRWGEPLDDVAESLASVARRLSGIADSIEELGDAAQD